MSNFREVHSKPKLHDSVIVVMSTCPQAILLAMITMRKSTHGFPCVSHMGYGALLGGPLGHQSSAITICHFCGASDLLFLDTFNINNFFEIIPFLSLSSLFQSHVSALLFSSQSPLLWKLPSQFLELKRICCVSEVDCCTMFTCSCHIDFFPFSTASSENSFSSDSSHEYCVPPENSSPPEPPTHREDYEDTEGIYVEVRHKHIPWDYTLSSI